MSASPLSPGPNANLRPYSARTDDELSSCLGNAVREVLKIGSRPLPRTDVLQGGL